MIVSKPISTFVRYTRRSQEAPKALVVGTGPTLLSKGWAGCFERMQKGDWQKYWDSRKAGR